ncbi:hypothetical protein Godav_003103 [Gossypium davidsonii]|uniref:Uncharacterized protein n=1 Tax=Gossypium davidsonii TaxID=34287 RepID=A0A7J8SYN9_GOSDV|nr:hypothetical protein [Gossypium davidsonii]
MEATVLSLQSRKMSTGFSQMALP